jgi:hypothetical protein
MEVIKVAKVKRMVAAITFMVIGLAIFMSSASAHSAHHKAHHQGNPFMKGWKHLPPGVSGGVSESSASSEVIVLAYNSFKKGTEIDSPRCHWTDGENSGETASGEVFWFYDTHMYVCPNKNSPTGWVKVKGGMTGAHCYNAVKPNTPPKPRLKIVLVRTFGKFKAVANAHAREKVKGSCGFAYAAARAHGMAYGVTRVQARNNAKVVANAKAKASAYAKAKVLLVCSPPAVSPPSPPAEIKCGFNEVKNAAGNCVHQSNEAEQKCEAEGGSWNGNTQMCTIIQINGNCSNIIVINGSGNTVENYQEGNCTVEESPPPPCGCKEEPEIRITGKTELNMIPAGKTSGEFYVNTYASESGGTLTVDPGIGGVSSCNSSTPESTITLNVPSGASKECVILYAPEDGDKPASMTVTMTACLGSVCDEETETVPITYPTRPS